MQWLIADARKLVAGLQSLLDAAEAAENDVAERLKSSLQAAQALLASLEAHGARSSEVASAEDRGDRG